MLSIYVEPEDVTAAETNGKRKEKYGRCEERIESEDAEMEDRVLERIGYVMRMSDERMTKAVVLGWVKELEKWENPAGRRRKTVSYIGRSC